tara:strand:- start:798 stop:1301 length:504 start_codon:yes stop_codon:yes gene_type:complete
MIIFKILFFIPVLLIYGCGQLDFVYKIDENINNPLYNKTKVEFTGFDLPILKRYSSSYFGKSDKLNYKLNIDVVENKKNISVKTNQAVSKLRYELNLSYRLKSLKKNCLIYQKTIISNFTTTPKSSGYNFGSDRSLDKKYELAISDNFTQFISFISDADMSNCLNES